MAIADKVKEESLSEEAQTAINNAKEEVKQKPYAKQFGRFVSHKNLFLNDAWPAYAVDEYLDVWYKEGYKLHTAIPFDNNRDGVGIFYILVLDE